MAYMGTIYRQAGRKTWMLKYYPHKGARPVYESSGTDDYEEARTQLRKLEGDVAHGKPATKNSRRMRFEDGADDILADYKVNQKKTLDHLQRRLDLHLSPWFRGRRLAAITSTEIRAYVAHRIDEKASNAEINRELAIVKRIYSLAIKAGKLFNRPHIEMLQERNTRQGFFERKAFESVRRHLPEDLRPLVTVAYLTGWRVPSELLTLQWRQVDLKAKTLRLEPGQTKNAEGRVFPYGKLSELDRAILEQHRKVEALKKQGTICPWVFHRKGKRIADFRDAWDAACTAAGYPGRIPHDFRRTSVRNLVRAGVPEKQAMLLTGHKTRSVFDRYAIVNEADLNAAVGKLQEALVSALVSGKPKRRSGHGKKARKA